MISISLLEAPITVSASGDTFRASISQAAVLAQASGGVGPQGATGVTTLGGAQDVEFGSIASGDVLRYSGGKWRNYPERNLVDGGNW